MKSRCVIRQDTQRETKKKKKKEKLIKDMKLSLFVSKSSFLIFFFSLVANNWRYDI